MKTKEEKNQLGESSNRLLLIVALVVGGIMLAAILYNVFQTGPGEVGSYQPEVRPGDAQFLRSAPPETEDETTQPEQRVQESTFQPPETIFQRAARQREESRQQQDQRQQTQPHQQQQQDRSRLLYEQALESQISVGGSIATNSAGSDGPGRASQARGGFQEPIQNADGYRGSGRTGTQRGAAQRQVTQFESPITPYSIMEGTLIEATLQTAISSALPGNITGVINRDIFDSVNQNHLLIPRGSRLVGSYESSIAFDQRKLMMSWDRIIFPDGRSMRLPGVPTHDLQGMSGLGGSVNTHFWSIFGQSAMLSLIGAGASVAIAPGGGGSVFAGLSPRQTIAMQVAQDFQRVANMVMQRNMNRQPTIEIEAGTPFTIFVLDDIFFEEPFTYTELYYD